MNNAAKIFLAFAFCSLCLFSTLGGRTLENTDYFKYAEIGREILELKSWTILHYNGEIYVDKPPFHYWNVALSYMAFGVNTFAARFPSALFSLITLLAVLFFTRRETKSPDAGILSCLILLSSYGYFFFSHRTRVDIEYGAFFCLSLFSFYAAMGQGRRRYLLFSFFWLFTGIGFMYKGPVIFLNLVVVTAYWILAKKKGFSYAPLQPFLLTLPLVFLPAAPWFYKLFKHKEFLQYAAIFQDKEIMKRSAGIFYYIPELIKKFFPAILFLPVFYKALKAEQHKDKSTESFIWFLLIWFSSIFLLLHIPAAKTHRYLIPIFPPLAMLAGWGITVALRDGLYKQFLNWSGTAVCALATCFFMAMPFIVWKKHGLSILPFIMSFLMLAVVYFSWKKNIKKVLILFICVPMIYLYLDFFSALRNDKTSEAENAYKVLTESSIQADEVVVFKDCGRNRALLSFYFNRLLPCADTLEGIQKFKAVLVEDENFAEIALPGYREFTVGAHKSIGKDIHILIRQ